MRILIDLQGAQTGSRFRGIGRSSLARAKSIIRNRGDHEVLLLLNGLFEDTIEPIRRDFSAILPTEHILVFSVPAPVTALAAENAWRIGAAELIREWMIAALMPDVVLIPSLFEGPSEPAIVSIGRLGAATRTAVILHDLIPFLDPQTYLGDPTTVVRKWYYSKIEYLRRADLLLAVSDSARREALEALGFDSSRTLSVSSAVDESFAKTDVSPQSAKALLQRIGVRRKFIMHASTIEPRKNFDGLIRAFGLLPRAVREAHQLVLVGDGPEERTVGLRQLADDVGLTPDEVIFAGYISDSDLVSLYSLCTLFVFPSFHEGFGLPPLEAMSCGAAVIGSNATSIPEVIGRKDALFDPHSDQSMAALIERALTDEKFWRSLKDHAREWSKRFSWDHSAQLSLRAMEKLPARAANRKSQHVSVLLRKIAAIRTAVTPERKDLVAVADSIARNEREISRSRRGRDDAALRPTGRGSEAAENGERRDDEIFVENLYRIFHEREPDPDGFEAYVNGLRSGRAPHELVAEFLNSAEFSKHSNPARRVAPGVAVPPSDPVIEVIRHQVWGTGDRPNILLLKLDHIGDFVMTLDAFRLIRDTWPKAEITLVCGPWNTSIAEQSGLFDSIISCDFYPESTTNYDGETVIERGIKEYGSLTLGAYDLAVDLRYFSDNRILLSHTDAKYRAGYEAEGVPLDLALPVGSEHDMTAHIGARTMALAAAVAWTFGEPAGGARDGLLNGRAPVRHFEKGVVVGISPGTRNALRSWGRERFAELARLLCERGFQIVLIGSKADRSDTQFIAGSLPKADVIDLAGTLPIVDIPPVFAGLDLFIGGETGTTHMAAAIGVPTICIYSGQTNVDSWRPVGPHVVTLRGNVSCSPCFLRAIEDCPWNRRCMDIPPARVAAEASELRARVFPSRTEGRLLAPMRNQRVRTQPDHSGVVV